MIMKRVNPLYNCYARVRFYLHGISPRNLKRGIYVPSTFVITLDNCVLSEALDVINTYCDVYDWELLTYDCYDSPYERGFRL